ncbi:MAG: integration host factor subunit alpha [Deltaproteobacteria bacterium]|nr:integration host factor subunit alpha [Deltaproteobacteria bacterium]
MTLTKSHIARTIQDRLSLPANPAYFFINSLLEIMKQTLESGEHIMLSGFGKFQVKDKKDRRGRNPQTGNHLILDARRVVTFKCSDVLKRKMNGE